LDYAEVKDSFTSTGAAPVQPIINPSKFAANPKAGLGLQYDFNQSVGVRAEAERYRINDAVGNKGDIDLVSVGLVYRFGVNKPAPVPAPKPVVLKPVDVPAPPPVVVTPPPAPIVVAAVVPAPVLSKVVFSTDSSAGSLFAFGTATLNPEGQQALDKFATDLKGASYEVITVTGHTDRIGSFAYNMKLSKRRAEAVMDYLVVTSGIPSDKITAKGMADSDPVTKPGECIGKKETKKLIACLGPDRRVEVEVTATRTSNEIATLPAQ
jgi:OOP family OmpA-OmpF porin